MTNILHGNSEYLFSEYLMQVELKLNQLYKANKTRSEMAKKTLNDIYQTILNQPYINSYEIAEAIDKRPGTVGTPLDKLYDEGKILCIQTTVKNRIQKRYFVPEVPISNKIFLPKYITDQLNWTEGLVLYFLAKESQYFVLKEEITDRDYLAISTFQITLEQDQKGLYFTLPYNWITFYQIETYDNSFSANLRRKNVIYSVTESTEQSLIVPNPQNP